MLSLANTQEHEQRRLELTPQVPTVATLLAFLYLLFGQLIAPPPRKVAWILVMPLHFSKPSQFQKLVPD